MAEFTVEVARELGGFAPSSVVDATVENFTDALGLLALHAESGRRASIYAPGRSLLAWTKGDHIINLAKE